MVASGFSLLNDASDFASAPAPDQGSALPLRDGDVILFRVEL
jgi:hypothetical protein